MPIHSNQRRKHNGQQKPPSRKTKEAGENNTQKYVVLPHHPLYGRQVTILKRQVATTYVKCTIEDPAHPGFCYQIREYWLSSSVPPSPPISPTPEEAVCLPLISLDKMVQRLLTTPYFRRIMDDDQADQANTPTQSRHQSASDDLAPTSSDQSDATRQSFVLPRTRKSRRD